MAPRPEVTFYILDEASSAARLRLACRIVDKAYRAGQCVLIWHTDAAELTDLDALLWTFGDDRGFIPHDLVTPGPAQGGPVAEAPVLLTTEAAPEGAIDVLINLAESIPPLIERAARVVEVIDGDPGRREAGRTRFRAYRELGCEPVSHNVRS
ncbi:MAG: DNA polymerase III subunit chi [Steroidobacteraceae bacterium]